MMNWFCLIKEINVCKFLQEIEISKYSTFSFKTEKHKDKAKDKELGWNQNLLLQLFPLNPGLQEHLPVVSSHVPWSEHVPSPGQLISY